MTKEGFTINAYQVTDTEGEIHTIYSRWMFKDDGGDLVFRHGERGNSKIIAAFGAGRWISVKLVKKEDTTNE